MACTLNTYPLARQAAPAAPAGALRAAAERVQQIAATGVPAELRRPNYLLDVPVSAIDVERWEKRWQEASGSAASAHLSAGKECRASGCFQTASSAYAARTAAAAAASGEGSAAAPALAGPTKPMAHLAPFPAFVFSSVKTLPMTQLLKLRRQWLPHRQRFPLHQQRMAFLDAVLNHAVVALVGPAGSGRTLQVPIVLSETEVLKRRRLVVVSANATAARLTVLRLREERGEDVRTSRSVAAALPNLLEATESTSVLVTTAEVLLRQLLCDPCLDDVGCVVFDDAHLRTESTELCLSLLRDLLTVQQQKEQQQLHAATAGSSAEGGGGGDGSTSASGDAVRRRRLHLVLNCPDEATATLLLGHLAPARCKTTTCVLQPPAALVTASTTLYLEEAVQWLLKCEKEGSCPVRDGGSGDGTVESSLLSYAENVDAVARIMAAGDADFARSTPFRQYWWKLIEECVDQYDRADRQVRGQAAAPLPAILVVAPNNYYVHVIVRAFEELRAKAAEEDSSARRVYSAVAEDVLFETVVAAAQRTVVREAGQRWVIVATPELSQTALPSSVDVGLVVDCARNTYTPVDAATMADGCVTEYSSIAQLRYRRRLAKLTVSDAADGGRQSAALAPVVIQLISKAVLHSAQNRRLNADPGQHIVFRLPFHQYVELYQVLQAREEAILAQRAAIAANLGLGPQGANKGSESSLSVASKISTLLSSLLIGVPASTASKYETVRRVMVAVEWHLRASGHVAVDTSPGSFSNGRMALQPLGVLTLCLPVPLPVARLLLAGSLLRPSVAALTALAALWCCSDLLSLRGVGAVRAADAPEAAQQSVEEQDALLHEARLFFSRESLSDAVSAFHVYQMWCSVRGTGAAETDFLAECGVSQAVLQVVLETQVGLCGVLRTYGLATSVGDTAAKPGEEEGHGEEGESSAAPITSVDRAESAEERALRAAIAAFTGAADSLQRLRDALGAAMAALSQDVSASRALHACVTAALYPSCTVPTGEEGIGLLYDCLFVTGTVVGGGDVSGGSGGGRRVVSFAGDSLLADSAECGRAAGRPFLYLAKSIADEASREAAGATATATAAVVEQLTPLHEAAALVFCGQTYERPRRAPLRCRGWTSMLTTSWRETRRARGLPPVAQLPPVSIAVQSYDTVHCQQVVSTMDQNVSLTMRATTLRWLQQLRTHVRRQLTSLVRGGAHAAAGEAAAERAAHVATAAELAEAWAWWERRHATGREWLREERLVVAHQRDNKAAADGGSEEEQAEEGGDEHKAKARAAAARAAAMRQQLFGYYEWQLRPGAPAATVMPSAAERKAAARSAAAAAGGGKAAAASDAKDLVEEDADDDGDAANAEAEAPATYTGKLPPADVDHIFRHCARSVAAKGTREAETRLLRDSPEMFSFLNPEDQYHEYYLFLLRQAAPDMEVLGDNLEELITFLEGVEAELREELGIAAPEDAQGVLGSGGTANPAKEQEAYAGRGGGMWGASGGQGGGEYEVHDIEDDDTYAGDGSGGLQLESAAVMLKKSAGPTLAEQIEQSRRAPTAAKAEGGAASIFAAPVAVQGGVMGDAAGAGAAGGAAPTLPFVSTSAGETLADKLRAMQQAAMTGSGGGGAHLTGVNAAAPFSTDHGGAGQLGPGPAVLQTPPPGTGVVPSGSGPGPYPYSAGYNPSASANAHGGSLFEAPTAEELLALLGPAPPQGPPSMPAPSAAVGGGESVLGVLANTAGLPPAMYSPAPVNPLSVPPPALPPKAVEERPPSVLVYPIPDCRRFGGNVRLMLARSLGEALNMRVGPTLIVGRVARLDVPNRNVEARALALKTFQCAEETVHILRNDRIIDDPDRERRERERREVELATAVLGVDGVDPAGTAAMADPSAFVTGGGEGSASAMGSGAGSAQPAVRIGVLSSSDDDDDDSSSSSSSSSSSASSSSSSV